MHVDKRVRTIRRFLVIISLLILIFVLAASAFAYMRSSDSYEITIDENTRAGGRSSSESYVEHDSGAGQSSPIGYSLSPSFRNNAGVVQMVTTSNNGFILY